MSRCLVCLADGVEALRDFGPQPICNRFLADPRADELTHRMVLGACGRCGVVQLVSPLAATELAPRCDWITYREPEAHLDDMVAWIRDKVALPPTASFLGVSFKDDTTLARCAPNGATRTRRLDPAADLGIDRPGAGVESVQDRLRPETAAGLAARHGRFDVVVARHVLEHAHAPASFVAALRELLVPGGTLVLEVPDCAQALDRFDYTMMWEEHTLYFTRASFRSAVEALGFEILGERVYPYSTEASLAIVAADRSRPLSASASPISDDDRARAIRFAASFTAVRNRIGDRLRRFREREGKIALFGAGHLSCTFVNLFGVADIVELVADDHPKKLGLFMPGSRLPIVATTALVDRDIRWCLLGVGPEVEDKVIERQVEFSARGGRFSSILPGSTRALEAATMTVGSHP